MMKQSTTTTTTTTTATAGTATSTPSPIQSPVQGLTYVNNEGPRMRRVREVLNRALNNSKESVKTKWFTNVLRTVEAPERLHHQIDERRKKRKRDHGGLTLSDIPAFKAMVQDDSIDNILRDVTENVRTSFEQIVKKRKLVEKLNRLDKLVNEQPVLPGTNERCPPTLKDEPENILRAERMKSKQTDLNRLQLLLKKEQERHEILKKDVAKEKEIAEKCVRTLKTYSDKVKQTHMAATQHVVSHGNDGRR